MTSVDAIEYDRVRRDNLHKTLNRRKFNRILNEKLKSHDEGSVIVIETPVENYLDANVSSVKSMIDNGYEGIYLSFQRPFKNISSLFEQNDINLGKLFVFDCASVFSESGQDCNPRCINLSSSFKMEDIVKKVCSSIQHLTTDKRFIFVDSLSTLAIHESFSDTLRFSEFLINSVRRKESDKITFVFNVAIEHGEKRYIENINVYADDHIHLGLCT
jgi:hypothetical protein